MGHALVRKIKLQSTPSSPLTEALNTILITSVKNKTGTVMVVAAAYVSTPLPRSTQATIADAKLTRGNINATNTNHTYKIGVVFHSKKCSDHGLYVFVAYSSGVGTVAAVAALAATLFRP